MLLTKWKNLVTKYKEEKLKAMLIPSIQTYLKLFYARCVNDILLHPLTRQLEMKQIILKNLCFEYCQNIWIGSIE